MKLLNQHLWTAIFPFSLLLVGCELTEDDREKITQLADQIIITYPANEATVVDSIITVRSDIPASADAQEVTLYVDGVEVAKDSDGAPWEVSWPAYYWADGQEHTLLLKTVTGTGVEIRNNQEYKVTVSTEANKALSFTAGIDGMSIQDTNSIDIAFHAFPGANSYEVKYSTNETTNFIELENISAKLTDLQVGEYTVRYRAIQNYSETTQFVGPWSFPASFELLPPELPRINKPLISEENGIYSFNISWESIEENNSYSAFFKKADDIEYVSYELGSTDSFELDDLRPGSYKFQLQSTNDLGHKSLISEVIDINLGVFLKRFGKGGEDRASFINTTSAGEYLVQGTTTSYGNSAGDNWIFLLDKEGNLKWEYISDSDEVQHNYYEVTELLSQDIIAFGSTGLYRNSSALIAKLSANGVLVWERKYQDEKYDSLRVKGVSEVSEKLYAFVEAVNCRAEGQNDYCRVVDHLIYQVDPNNGSLLSTSKVESVNDVRITLVNSVRVNSSGYLILSMNVESMECVGYNCTGAALALVNTDGEIKNYWDSLGSYDFHNGRYADEAPWGGYVLTGQVEWSEETPAAILSSDLDPQRRASFPMAYSNWKEYVAFSDDNMMYQLVQMYGDSEPWPILISMDMAGRYVRERTFTELKAGYSASKSLDSTPDGGLIFLFDEYQSGYSNSDVVVIKSEIVR